MDYIKKPLLIESTSFQIITEEAKDALNRFSDIEKEVVKRVIHTTADFEYADLIEFSPEAVNAFCQAISKGENIYADTTMIGTGIRRKEQKFYDFECMNFVHDSDVYKMAEENGITRSMAGIRKASEKGFKIYAIGNAPTAIFKLKELMEDGLANPDVIIGVPVGFVGAVESKEILSDMGVPYIRINGRKGGSTVAVAIINALIKMMYETDNL